MVTEYLHAKSVQEKGKILGDKRDRRNKLLANDNQQPQNDTKKKVDTKKDGSSSNNGTKLLNMIKNQKRVHGIVNSSSDPDASSDDETPDKIQKQTLIDKIHVLKEENKKLSLRICQLETLECVGKGLPEICKNVDYLLKKSSKSHRSSSNSSSKNRSSSDTSLLSGMKKPTDILSLNKTNNESSSNVVMPQLQENHTTDGSSTKTTKFDNVLDINLLSRKYINIVNQVLIDEIDDPLLLDDENNKNWPDTSPALKEADYHNESEITIIDVDYSSIYDFSKVKKNVGINRFVSDMLTVLYSQEKMMTSSYTGKRGSRKLIEQTRMNYIKREAKKVFPFFDEKEFGKAVQGKLSNQPPTK